jgi:cell division septal protein FtsQ
MRPQRQVRRSQTRPSYARRQSQSPRLPRIKLPRLQLGWFRWLAIALVLFGLVSVFASSTSLKSVTIHGNQSLDSDHLQRVAREGARKQWFGSNTLFLNAGALQDYIEKAEPGVKTAKLHRSGLHGIDINVTERQPTLNWKTGGAVYLLDADGTVIGPSKGIYVKLPTVIDSNNLPVKVGDRVAPTTFITFTSQMVARLPEAGLSATEISVPQTTSEVYIKTNKGYTLKLDTTRGVEGELADLKAVQAQLVKAKKAPVEYIDLRIEHKAYYK